MDSVQKVCHSNNSQCSSRLSRQERRSCNAEKNGIKF